MAKWGKTKIGTNTRVVGYEREIETNPEVYRQRVQHFVKQENYEQAIRDCLCAMHFSNNDPNDEETLLRLYYMSGNYYNVLKAEDMYFKWWCGKYTLLKFAIFIYLIIFMISHSFMGYGFWSILAVPLTIFVYEIRHLLFIYNSTNDHGLFFDDAVKSFLIFFIIMTLSLIFNIFMDNIMPLLLIEIISKIIAVVWCIVLIFFIKFAFCIFNVKNKKIK